MRNLNRVHLTSLRAVEAVGRLGNLAAAADELGVTPGAVSQQVQRAEEALGRSLFSREAKGLRLTPLGAEVCERLTAGMRELSRGVALAERRAHGVLTISIAPIFASKWLVWKLDGFRKVDPDIRVRIDADVGLVDPNTADVDACIRVGRGKYPGVKAEWMLDQEVFPVCNPRLAQSLKKPSDLANVPIIRDRYAMFEWDVWLKPNGLDASILGEGPVYSDGALGLDAAIAGQGVFLAWEPLASYALASGQAVAPFPDRYPTGESYWFVTGETARGNPHVTRFRDWLTAELQSSVGGISGRPQPSPEDTRHPPEDR
ncbi:LysR substrate-binding domain-containing protein [Oricola indica]|uniref:LysR substrate-binding domain-containing protein n=1 Tax=Oricola indica TaxID=2872591 RepID=UPI001CBD2189|nr:LysR substrate-binding domain-containing protein [Oricola indica]